MVVREVPLKPKKTVKGVLSQKRVKNSSFVEYEKFYKERLRRVKENGRHNQKIPKAFDSPNLLPLVIKYQDLRSQVNRSNQK